MGSHPTPDSVAAPPPGQEGGSSAPPGGGALARFGGWLARRRRLVLVSALIAVIVAVPFGADVESRLSEGGITSPGSEAARADALLNTEFSAGSPHLVFVVKAPGSVDGPEVARQGERLTAELAAERGVVQAASYWSLGRAEPLRAEDGRSALVLVRLAGDEDTVRKSAKRLVPQTVGERDGVEVTATGVTAVRVEIEERSSEDLVKAELLAAPVVLFILLLVFRSVVAALLPLLVGVIAVIGSFVILRLLDLLVPVSVFSVNITTALGLGLAIDYSLFVVTRYREELAGGREVRAAIAETVRTAGRTVVFSALTVALSLSAMLVFPMYHLRSFAYSGIAVVLLAAVGSVVALPAMLAVLGRRVDALSVPRLRRRRKAAPKRDPQSGFWHRIATAVMKRPVPFSVAVVALLLVLGVPFLRVEFADSDDRVLPPSSPAYQAAQVLREDFDSREGSPVSVVLPKVDASARAADVAAYAQEVSRLPGVTRVDAATGFYAQGRQVEPPNEASARFGSDAGTWLAVVSDTEPYSQQGMDLVGAVRGVPAPADALVGGQAALLVDSKATLGEKLPWALGIIAASTLVLLFLFTGSLLIPVKAVVLNLLSLTATFGAMVFVFQDGNLRWLVGDFVVTGMIDIDTPVLLFCVAFGLSMDYEVFMLSRIKEEYARSGDNTASVAWGLEHTGRLITLTRICRAAASAVPSVMVIGQSRARGRGAVGTRPFDALPHGGTRGHALPAT